MNTRNVYKKNEKDKNGISIIRWLNKVFKFVEPFAFAVLYNKEFKIIVKYKFIEYETVEYRVVSQLIHR